MALAAGAHVLCEKLLALTLKDCEAMEAAAKAAGRVLMTGQVLRWRPEYMRIAEEIWRLGPPLYVQTRRLQHARRQDGWHLQRELGGGALFDLFVHDMDFLLGLFGTDVKVVAANGSRGVCPERRNRRVRFARRGEHQGDAGHSPRQGDAGGAGKGADA